MKFTKMQGCGNDYIYINCFEEKVENPSELSIKLSDRHFGIGSDGLVLIKPSKVADFFMDMYNADGSRGKMCGNAIRCVAKYVYDNKMTDKTLLMIETLSGIKKLELFIKNDTVQLVKVDMGIPSIEPEEVPMILTNLTHDTTCSESLDNKKSTEVNNLKNNPSNTNATDLSENKLSDVSKIVNKSEQDNSIINIDTLVTADGKEFLLTGISMGNPHAVIFVEEVKDYPIEQIGPKLESHDIFPEKANIEFVKIVSEDEIDMRVWERGSAETYACGTGACASAYSAYLHGYCKPKVNVNMKGGTLIIEYGEDGHIYMTGPATKVFSGEI